jgi:hypothetical protein
MAAEFYKGIKDPNELRRSLLECSKDVIKSLQSGIDYESLRKRKESRIIKLKREVSEINQLYVQLNSILPEEEMEEKSTKKPKRKRENYDIRDLSEELSEIESKMSKLGI